MSAKEITIHGKHGSFAGYLSTPATVLHLAGCGSYIRQDAIDGISASAKTRPRISVYVYPGMPHAFCRAHDPRHFDAASCRLDLFKTFLA